MKPDDHESVAHNIIVPMKRKYVGSNVADGVYSNNAWLLDDRFMTFRTILSDFTMREVIDEIVKDDPDSGPPDLSRPDIAMVFSADPSAADRFDVVIVEFKRRGTNDRDE